MNFRQRASSFYFQHRQRMPYSLKIPDISFLNKYVESQKKQGFSKF